MSYTITLQLNRKPDRLDSQTQHKHNRMKK